MAVTEEDLKDFHRFAKEKLANGGVESLSQLAAEWEEFRDTVADVRQGITDFEAGRHKPAEQAFADIRKKLGWTSD